MYEYSRDVFYYETDQMGVVHHSNFIRWLEEARTAYYDSIGISYAGMEKRGVLSPIVSVDMRFRHFARYGDRFTVRLSIEKYTGARFIVSYTAANQKGDTLFAAESTHAFIGRDYRPVSLVKALPDIHEKIKAHMAANEKQD